MNTYYESLARMYKVALGCAILCAVGISHADTMPAPSFAVDALIASSSQGVEFSEKGKSEKASLDTRLITQSAQLQNDYQKELAALQKKYAAKSYSVQTTYLTKLRAIIKSYGRIPALEAGVALGKVCPADTYQCPSGAVVGRSGLSCSFACDGVSTASAQIQSVDVAGVMRGSARLVSDLYKDSPASFGVGYDARPAQFSVDTPPLNTSFRNMTYGTVLTRVTDVSQLTEKKSSARFVRHDSARQTVFNADGTYALMVSANGWYRLYKVQTDTNTMQYVRTLPWDETAEVNWSSSDASILYAINTSGKGMKILTYDMLKNTIIRTYDLTDVVQAKIPDAQVITTRGEGRPSLDDMVWCLQVETKQGNAKGLIAYDLRTKALIGALPSTDKASWVSTGPTGTTCVAGYNTQTISGVRAYTSTFSNYALVTTRRDPGDIILTKDGKDGFVYFDIDAGMVVFQEIWTEDTLIKMKKSNLFKMYGAQNSATAGYVSGVSTGVPGKVVISTYGCSIDLGAKPCTEDQWFNAKILVARVSHDFKADQDLITLTPYMDSKIAGVARYYGQPHAVPNRDLSKVVFASSWGSPNVTDIAEYMIDVPQGSLTK